MASQTFSDIHYYLIPGMGADHRLFQHFNLEHGEVHYLNWIPHEKSKNLSEYAVLMASTINTDNNVIIGSSMGGMVAVEMSRIVQPLATILVSAPTGRHEFPPILKTFDHLSIHKMMGPSQLAKLARLADLFMGFKNEEQRALFYDMLESNGPEFLHFSVKAVLGWKNATPPHGRFIQILGSEDKLFKSPRIKNAQIISGSGHFTAFEKGAEVSQLINDYIQQIIPSELKRI
jgi:pimeloyl-ACP methyl ester carboxylesterase